MLYKGANKGSKSKGRFLNYTMSVYQQAARACECCGSVFISSLVCGTYSCFLFCFIELIHIRRLRGYHFSQHNPYVRYINNELTDNGSFTNLSTVYGSTRSYKRYKTLGFGRLIG